MKNPQHYMDVIMALDNIDVPADKYMELPSLIFMLPSFLNDENAPYVAQVVEQLSANYFVMMRDRLDLLACSTIALGWARSYMFNQDLLDQMADQIIAKHNEGIFMEEGAESEVANVLSGLSQLGYKNEEVIEILWGYLVGPDYEKTGEISEQYDLYNLYNIITSFARIAPKASKYLEAFIP